MCGHQHPSVHWKSGNQREEPRSLSISQSERRKLKGRYDLSRCCRRKRISPCNTCMVRSYIRYSLDISSKKVTGVWLTFHAMQQHRMECAPVSMNGTGQQPWKGNSNKFGRAAASHLLVDDWGQDTSIKLQDENNASTYCSTGFDRYQRKRRGARNHEGLLSHVRQGGLIQAADNESQKFPGYLRLVSKGISMWYIQLTTTRWAVGQEDLRYRRQWSTHVVTEDKIPWIWYLVEWPPIHQAGPWACGPDKDGKKQNGRMVAHFPNSVWMSSRPCWGRINISPSLLTNAFLSIDVLAR